MSVRVFLWTLWAQGWGICLVRNVHFLICILVLDTNCQQAPPGQVPLWTSSSLDNFPPDKFPFGQLPPGQVPLASKHLKRTSWGGDFLGKTLNSFVLDINYQHLGNIFQVKGFCAPFGRRVEECTFLYMYFYWIFGEYLSFGGFLCAF